MLAVLSPAGEVLSNRKLHSQTANNLGYGTSQQLSEREPLDQPDRPAPYAGQDLGPRPHIAVIFRDQIGDFVVATPLMRGLRERYPDLILDYLGGERTREIEEASSLVDARYSLFGPEEGLEALPHFLEDRLRFGGPYDLVINLESDPPAAQASALTRARYVVGATLDDQGRATLPPAEGIDRLWHDVWNRADLTADYPELGGQHIAEIFCRLARVETDFAHAEVPVLEPRVPIPPILFATGARRSAKLWAPEHWLDLGSQCLASGFQVGLLGAAPSLQASAYHVGQIDDALVAIGITDLRGTLTLPQAAGALKRARALVTVDNGVMHLAAAIGTPTVALFGASPQRIWAPPVPWVTVLEPSNPCSLCEENRFRNDDCLLPVHQCMLSVSPARVIAELQRALQSSS